MSELSLLTHKYVIHRGNSLYSILTAIMLFMTPQLSWGENRDPMRPDNSSTPTSKSVGVKGVLKGADTKKSKLKKEGMVLNSIAMRGGDPRGGEHRAVISGKRMQVGDTIGNMVLTHIYYNRVTLQRDNNKQTLRLLPVTVKQ